MRNVTLTIEQVRCAQCGRPPADSGELALWRPHSLVDAGEFDETTASMLLCPDCAEEGLSGAYEEGEAD